jgi:hypothetical protein
MNIAQLRACRRERFASAPPAGFSRDLLAQAICYRLQEEAFGGLSVSTGRLLRSLAKPGGEPPRRSRLAPYSSASIRAWFSDCASVARAEPRTSSYWSPPPKICGNWRNSSPSRSRPSPCEAKRRCFASLAAAAHTHRARLKTGFFYKILSERAYGQRTENFCSGKRLGVPHTGPPATAASRPGPPKVSWRRRWRETGAGVSSQNIALRRSENVAHPYYVIVGRSPSAGRFAPKKGQGSPATAASR